MTLTSFIVIFEGLSSYEYSVTPLDVEGGSINWPLPLKATMVDVCSLNGMIFGRNEIGNSSVKVVQLPHGKALDCSSAILAILQGWAVQDLIYFHRLCNRDYTIQH